MKLLGANEAKGLLVMMFCLLLARNAMKLTLHLWSKSKKKKKKEGDLVLLFAIFRSCRALFSLFASLQSQDDI